MTKKEVLLRIKGLKGNVRKSTICALIGHSNIITGCFGYVYCARCDDQIGDTLAGAYDIKKAVIVNHDCDTCHSNYKKLTWKDKLETPNPF